MYKYTQNIDALIFLSLSLTARIRFRRIATELLNRIKANQRRRKVKNIGGWARFRILGGGGGGREANFPAGTLRRCDVITSHRCQCDVMCPLGF